MSDHVVYSVVIPMFNEEEVIEQTYLRLKEVMDRTGETYEFVFVNDGSEDRTLDILTSLCGNDHCVRVLNFSRNFGHQIAISAGLEHAVGDAVIFIDADLQDPPEVIPEMIAKWKAGYDVVYGQRLKRKGESVFKKLTAFLFYRFLRSMTNVNIPVDTGDFRLIDRKVCQVMSLLTEKNRYVRGLISWVGFRQTAVSYVRDERLAGETKYPLGKMKRFALDAILSFSYKPLKLAIYMGFGLSLICFFYLLLVLYQRLFTSTTLPGWTSTMAVTLFFHGITLIILGIIGEYIGRIYDESKQRPLYIIRDKMGYEHDEKEETNEQS